jgi:hypothetical protein
MTFNLFEEIVKKILFFLFFCFNTNLLILFTFNLFWIISLYFLKKRQINNFFFFFYFIVLLRFVFNFYWQFIIFINHLIVASLWLRFSTFYFYFRNDFLFFISFYLSILFFFCFGQFYIYRSCLFFRLLFIILFNFLFKAVFFKILKIQFILFTFFIIL